jgi:vacuolar-type H+-ATPase subunit E/Vma4
MRGMDKISEAILDKVKAEAKDIIKEAEARAKEEIEQAKKQQAARQEEQKSKFMQEAKEEATRIEAQALVKARQELSRAKADAINEIVDRVKKELSTASSDKSSFLNLLKEAADAIGINKIGVYVSPKDKSIVQELLKEDKELANKIVEIKEHDFTGGVMVEDIEGKTRIDNTYETRLEMLLPRLLPEIGKELF